MKALLIIQSDDGSFLSIPQELPEDYTIPLSTFKKAMMSSDIGSSSYSAGDLTCQIAKFFRVPPKDESA